jgi:histidinol dehydrogenase
MKIFETGRDAWEDICGALGPQAVTFDRSVAEAVAAIIADVRARGDQAVLDYGQKFDSAEMQDIHVTDEDIQSAYAEVGPDLLAAIRDAKANIEEFHRRQLRNSWIETERDRTLGQIIRPLERVGVYAPAAKAPLCSSVLMTALPAKVAGVGDVIMCCPPRKDGRVHPAMLVAAAESGIRKVFKAGGAQAIAAMALGTVSVQRVDKIVGPGNPYVTEAKRQLYGLVGIDMLAGPSEVLVLADGSIGADMVAADLLSQAEHAEDSRPMLITTERSLAHEVLNEIKRQKAMCSRSEIIGESLGEFGVVVICRNLDEAIELANYCAPEHLELLLADPWAVLPRIKNAGAIMLGRDSVVSVGDFVAGPSHTLPTNGTARFSSPLCVDDFIKKSSVIWYSKDALAGALGSIEALAKAEGFDAHARSARMRIFPMEEEQA